MKTNALKLIVIIACFIQALPIRAQAQKLKVKPADYNKWGTLSVSGLSPDGLWASYRMEYENGRDTLFLRKAGDTKTIAFPSVKMGVFSNNSAFFAYRTQSDSLCIYNLHTSTMIRYSAIKHFEFSQKGNYFAAQQTDGNGGNKLLLTDGYKTLREIPGVTAYTISDNGLLACSIKDGVIVADPKKGFEGDLILNTPIKIIKKMVWSDDSNILAFLGQAGTAPGETGPGKQLYHYNLKLKKLNLIHGRLNALTGKEISEDVQTPIILSADGQKVFFYTSDSMSTEKSAATLPEIWDSGTKLVYPAQQLYDTTYSKSKITVWYPDTGRIIPLATDEFPLATLTSDRNYALIYSHLTHEPQYKMVSDVDYYLVDVATGKPALFLKNQAATPYSIGSSPKGQYIHYFRMGHWWIYDTTSGEHINVTSGLGRSFVNSDFDEPGVANGYKCPGWTSGDEYIILYDRYDVWLVAPDGRSHLKITNGKESKVTYRICDYLYSNGKSQGSADFVKRHFDISKGFYIHATGFDKSSGYYFWQQATGTKAITYGAKKRGKLQKASEANACLYTEEDFETPPSLQFARPFKTPPVQLYQSNPHYTKYVSGASELVSYKNNKGDTLQGILYYPAGYQKGKKYPMVVYIYSNLSQNLHEYYNPVRGHQIGFQPVNYINDGYAVLMPDIRYEVGSPGKSIVDCVEAAVKYVIERGVADKDRVGLIGHSYGGYETCYLISQSKLFSAAVAGAAVTDVISSYLSMNTDTGDKMDWRFESQQYRLGISPFENLKLYLDHSTVMHAAKITTPLLIWAGKDDMVVDPKQGLELHLALRRLGKKNLFLVYPGQGHILTDKQAKIDLTERVKKWFDHFLKEPEI